MLGLVLLTPLGLLALILTLSSVERRLFGEHADLRLRYLTGVAEAEPARGAGSRAGTRDRSGDDEQPAPSAGKRASRRRGRMFRHVDPDRVSRDGGPTLATAAGVVQSRVQPTPTRRVGYLLPGKVFTPVSGECVRCGGDLSRGFAAARDTEGDLEAGVVCPCCEWLDDNERQQTGYF